jgi:tRNA-splicing ligase RtcB
MPDMHIGYGYPIGGVGAFSKEGVISVGGVGFDINCGVRTLKSNLFLKDVKPKIKQLVDQLFRDVPAGLGSRGEIVLSNDKVNEVLTKGSEAVVNWGYGLKEDLEFTESYGQVKGALPENVSELALKREKKQVGTLGSGNHYLEVQYVDEIYDKEIAKAWGLEKNQIIITLHCGSRALGHQIGTDYLKTLAEASRKYNIPIRDRELVCAPIESEEGKQFFSAMNCGINYAFANRQVIADLIRKSFLRIFPKENLDMVYDVGHNTCKVEEYKINNKNTVCYVHRKGATRAFGPGREELPKIYRKTGQPVIIGGTMGTASYLLVGTKEGEEKAFASVCHGSGRAMSRTQALKTWRADQIIKELEKNGIYVRAHGLGGLAEEAPLAYKPVEDVVDAVHNAGLARKVIRMKPIGNIKG